MRRTERTRPEPGTEDTVRERAVYWVSRERLGTLDAAAARERAVWLAQDPEHRHHYAAVQATMRQADLLDPAVLREMLADTNTRISRRRMVLGGAGACAAALLGAVALHRYRAASDPADLHATGRGERRRVVLADGSVLDLNTESRIHVTLRDQQRDVVIEHGEVLFNVSHDVLRPFVVHANGAEVRVTGTRFNVRLDGSVMTVALQEGGVQVSAGPWWNRKTAALRPGEVLRQEEGKPLAAPYTSNVAAITAWQRGRLVFTDAPLSAVVDELNRYLLAPARIGDASLAGLRVSGTVPIETPQAALDILPRIAPLRLVIAADGGAVLQPR